MNHDDSILSEQVPTSEQRNFGPSAQKLLILAVAWLVLGLLLSTISGLIRERHEYRDQAESKVAAGWGGGQRIGAPMLRFSFAPGLNAAGFERSFEDRWVLPDQATFDANMLTETRELGLFEIPVFNAELTLKAEFSGARIAAALGDLAAQVERVRVMLPVGDLRGMRSPLTINVTDLALRLAPSGEAFAGVHMLSGDLDATQLWSDGVRLEQQLSLAGTRSLTWLPTASELSVNLSGDWADPGFADGMLPRTREVGESGFKADWQVLDFNAGIAPVMDASQFQALALNRLGFGVQLQQPGDVYQRNQRAWKYGYLFVALSLAAFFLLELLLQRSLWALDYALIGVSQVVFYLLLLALSEHLGFALAYAISAAVFASMVGAFAVGLLGSRRHGAIAGTVLAGAYAMLYVLIGSESHALLLGALLATFLLALAMALVSRSRSTNQGPAQWAQGPEMRVPPGPY